MKSLKLSASLASLCLLISAGTAAAAETPLNLLFFGNSFTQGGSLAVSTRVQYLATAAGYATPVVVADLAGGTDLDRHIGQVANYPSLNVTNAALPAAATWDFLIFQGYSTEATYLRPANDNPFEEDALALHQAVANHPSGKGVGVTSVLYETWARRDLVPGSFPTLDVMQDEIFAGYQAAYDTLEGSGANVRLAAVGEGFRIANYDTSFYGGDNYHLTNKGYTFAALVLYRTIYNESAASIPYASVSSWAGVASSADWNYLTSLADATPIVVPEPSSLAWLGLGAIALLKRRARGQVSEVPI